MEKGKCQTCGGEITGYGFCPPCGRDYWDKEEKRTPFIVRFADDMERFETEAEAEAFVEKLHSARVERW